MPRLKHEALVHLVRNSPGMVIELLRAALGIALPLSARPRPTAAKITDLDLAEYRADGVYTVGEPPVAAYVVEAQGAIKPSKRRTWTMYSAGLFARLGCRPPGRGLGPPLYADFIYALLGKAARAALEKLMNTENYEYQSDFARKYHSQGRREGKAEALLELLAHKGFAVDAGLQARIEACHDSRRITKWLTRVLTATRLADVFADDAP